MRLPRSVRDADVAGKTVLVRSDLNVPLEDGRSPTTRASAPRCRRFALLLDGGAAEVRVCSHLGRPKTEEDRAKYAMAPVGARLRELLPDDRIDVLENTRFDPRETKNDPAFARELADGCDLYVNDAFGSAHRAHASTEGVAHLLPAYAGLLLLDELEHLGKLLGDVERPFVLISGGAKVDDKLGVLQNLGGRADTVLIGGKMAEQIRDENPLDFDVELPSDVVGAAAFAEDAESGVVPFDDLPDGWLGLDIGPETRDRFARAIARRAHDLLERADGRLRVAARSPAGTKAVAEAVAANEQAFSVVGGADSVRALNELGLADRDLLGLDRRRREPRAARGQGASRRRRDPGGWPMIVAGNWKMFPGPTRDRLAERLAGVDGVDVDRLPAVHALARCVERRPDDVRAERALGAGGRVHRRDLGRRCCSSSASRGSLVGHSERRQYFGETDARRRAARAGGARGGARRDRVRRRDAGGARLGRHGDGAPHPGRRDPRRVRHARAARARVRAGLGDRHRPHGDARAGAGRARVHQVAARPCRCSTAARSSPTTRTS